jgi:hypothetical protein
MQDINHARVERKARYERAAATGIRLQDAVAGMLYRITALYGGESQVFEYAGCTGSHDDEAFGVVVGAVAYFRDPVVGCHYLHTTSQLEPGGRRAQWFMVALTFEEAMDAYIEFGKERALMLRSS